jgi:Leucine-rich repeat (LRR) protein
LLTVLSFTGCGHDDEEIITFSDPSLEAAVRQAISKPNGDIYQAELVGMTSLNASWRGIVDLTGLEHATSLTHLDLHSNNISDISALASLTNVCELHLGWNQVSDISALAYLTSLTWLDLDSNQISDISAVADLTGLTDLYLGWNQIGNISAIASTTGMRILDLAGNKVSNISPLAGLTNLRELYLPWNQVSDISSLVANSGLGEGDCVDLGYNPLSDTSRYTYIPQLQARGVTVFY